MSFDNKITGGIAYLHWAPWTLSGIRHGFSGKALDFGPSGWEESSRKVKDAFECGWVFVQNQQHTTKCSDFRDGKKLHDAVVRAGEVKADVCADAMTCKVGQSVSNAPVCYGVITADCVPLIARCGEEFGLIHAGWRGLAGGIIEETLDQLGASDSECEIIIGPCAGSDNYEVGSEVVADLGVTARGRQLDNGKTMLDLVATVRARLEKYNPKIQVHATDVCTISDPRFHSYRRDGDKAGRSLTFLISN